MKRGFTLIEMLGILVVLAVIIVVSLPSIIQTNKNSKQAELDDAKKTLFMAAETYISLDDTRKAKLKSNGYYYVKLADLVTEGLLSSNLKNPGNNMEKTIVEGNWWVEARTSNGDVNYKLVDENPYSDEDIEADMVYSILIDRREVTRDKIGGPVDRYIYTNSNPNNYVKFNNELWRIVSLESDKTIKIVRDEFLGSEGIYDQNQKFGTNNTVSTSSTLIAFLNGTFLSDMTPAAQNLIVEHTFNTGTYTLSGLAVSTNLANLEATKKITTKVGLLNPSDYIQASDNADCTAYASYKATATNTDPCIVSNYLFRTAQWWTMNSEASGMVTINSEAGLKSLATTTLVKVRPVVYLSKDITIDSGNGSSASPFVFKGM